MKYAGYDYGGLITGSVKMLTTEYSASGSAYKTYADFAVFKDDDSYMKYRCEHLYKQSNYTRVPNYQKAIDTNNSELFLRALGEGGYYTASQDSYIAQYRSICQAYPLVAQLDSMTAEEFKNQYSGTTLIPGGGQDYQSADQWQKDIVNACSQTPWPGANLCATWTTRVYARAGHPVGGNGNTQLGNQGYGANYSQKRATTDLSQIKVGMLISAQYGSNTPPVTLTGTSASISVTARSWIAFTPVCAPSPCPIGFPKTEEDGLSAAIHGTGARKPERIPAMKKLKAWMTEHKKFSVIALCLLLMFTCGSAMSAINVSHHRAETAKEQNAGNNTDTTTAAEKKTKEETGKVELTDAQKEIIKGYDSDAKELIDTLSSSVWSVSEGRYTLKFADDSYVETVNGTPTVHSYAISRVEKTSDGYGGYLYTIVFETDTGTHIVTYTDGSGAAVNSDSKTPGENTISTLTSSTMFAQKNTAYERAEAVTNITVKGMNSEVTKLFGGDEKAVITALSKWCAVHYPSVTEATWQKVVNLDYENGVITTDFKLNDTNSVSITCVYEQSTGEFSFEG